MFQQIEKIGYVIMKKIIFILVLLFLTSSAALAQDEIILPKTALPESFPSRQKSEQIDFLKLNISKDEKAFLKKSWTAIKGQPTDDSLLLGMFSDHTGEQGFNQTNRLIGIDYKGDSIGTFRNSFYTQTYYAGISRKIYQSSVFGDTKFDVKYKLVGMHGYQDHYPALLGITPIIMPMFGFTKNHCGTDFMIIPSKKPIFVVNFRVNLKK